MHKNAQPLTNLKTMIEAPYLIAIVENRIEKPETAMTYAGIPGILQNSVKNSYYNHFVVGEA